MRAARATRAAAAAAGTSAGGLATGLYCPAVAQVKVRSLPSSPSPSLAGAGDGRRCRLVGSVFLAGGRPNRWIWRTWCLHGLICLSSRPICAGNNLPEAMAVGAMVEDRGPTTALPTAFAAAAAILLLLLCPPSPYSPSLPFPPEAAVSARRLLSTLRLQLSWAEGGTVPPAKQTASLLRAHMVLNILFDTFMSQFDETQI